MFRLINPLLLAFAVIAVPLWAQPSEEVKIDTLLQALAVPERIEIIREEQLSISNSPEFPELPLGPKALWGMALSAIYDTDLLYEKVRRDFSLAVQQEDIDAMLAFYTSDQGAKIVGLEISARRSFLDDAIEESSKASAAAARMDNTQRYQMIMEFVALNHLIDLSVSEWLNFRHAYMTGLHSGGKFASDITVETLLGNSQEQEIAFRSYVTDHIYALYFLAFQSLSDEELAGYIAFSNTEAAQAMNGALFAAFGLMYDETAQASGLAYSRFVYGQEL